jgi:hypothetical protein
MHPIMVVSIFPNPKIACRQHDCMAPSFLLTCHAVLLSSSVMQQGVDRGMRISRLSADVDNMIASLEPPPPKGSVTLVAHGMSASVCHATIPEPDETLWSR